MMKLQLQVDLRFIELIQDDISLALFSHFQCIILQMEEGVLQEGQSYE
jgi:hypothetical protein